MPAEYAQGLLDTNIVILRKLLDPEELPGEVPITAITLTETTCSPSYPSPSPPWTLQDQMRR